MPNLAERLRDGAPVVLDGGLGTLLEQNGQDVSGKLWASHLIVDEPDAVRQAHREFFAAGAEVATTASYQASFEGLDMAGIGRAALTGILRQAVRLAREAASEFDGDRYVAASVGPYGAMLADGSEFHGNYGKSVAELTRWHRARLDAYAEAGADLLAIETIPSLAEAEAIVQALAGTGLQAWVSLSARLGASPSGEPLREAYQVLAESDEVVALGINCSPPSEVLGAIQAAHLVSDKPIVVYPNSGEEWDVKRKQWIHHRTFTESVVQQWFQAGAAAVGGCCRVLPDEIQHVTELVRQL